MARFTRFSWLRNVILAGMRCDPSPSSCTSSSDVSFGVLAQVLSCWTAATSPLSRFFGGEAVEGRPVQIHVAARYKDGVDGRDW